jgi:hypothetical protein
MLPLDITAASYQIIHHLLNIDGHSSEYLRVIFARFEELG